jgi:hypothetical protein
MNAVALAATIPPALSTSLGCAVLLRRPIFCLADGTRALGLSLQQGRGDIITLPDAKVAGMARAHPIATVVVDAADQQSLGFAA